jgi:rhodanese-related sulfurtransferase
MSTQDQIAGELASADAWRVLAEEADAVLLDVRTRAEWTYVGVPQLDSLGKQAVFVEWQRYPDGSINPDFVEAVRAEGVDPDVPVLVICRSGQRSRAAAIALTGNGFKRCINVSDGFEGPRGEDGHRGRVAGWKAADLPWAQG